MVLQQTRKPTVN